MQQAMQAEQLRHQADDASATSAMTEYFAGLQANAAATTATTGSSQYTGPIDQTVKQQQLLHRELRTDVRRAHVDERLGRGEAPIGHVRGRRGQLEEVEGAVAEESLGLGDVGLGVRLEVVAVAAVRLQPELAVGVGLGRGRDRRKERNRRHARDQPHSIFGGPKQEGG